MIRPLTLTAAVFGLAACAGAAQAQIHSPQLGLQTGDIHRYQVDRHRYEMDRLRLQADQRRIEAAQHRLDARLNRLDIQSRRQSEPVMPQALPPLGSPEQERALRQAASERRRTITTGVGQIDAWLDRPASDRTADRIDDTPIDE